MYFCRGQYVRYIVASHTCNRYSNRTTAQWRTVLTTALLWFKYGEANYRIPCYAGGFGEMVLEELETMLCGDRVA